MEHTHVLGVVPARGGSKGIRRKNMAVLAGRPLLDYTVDAAKGSSSLTRIVVSTDDDEIASHAVSLGVQVPFMRSKELAADDTPILPVLRDLLEKLKSTEGYEPDLLVLLQPTSPFRQGRHIDEAVRLLLGSGCDSVVSVVRVPHQFNPLSVMSMEDGRLVGLGPRSPCSVLRRQDKPLVYARNGPAVLVTRTEIIVQRNELYGSDTRGVVMAEEESLDIDTAWDLKLAESILAMGGGGA